MLVDFSVRNFLSFKEETTLSMLTAKSVKDHEQDDATTGTCNVIKPHNTDLKLLKVAAIYGANNSGKSNLLRAIFFFKDMVLNSFTEDTILQRSKEWSFQFCVESSYEPISFEMSFIIGDNLYRYGFEIFNEAIESEWLFVKTPYTARESYCFKRDKNSIKVNSKTYKGAAGLSSMTRDNALFLSTCAIFNVEVALTIKGWIQSKFIIVSRLDDETLLYTAKQCANNESLREQIINFIKVLGLGIRDLDIRIGEDENISKTSKTSEYLDQSGTIVNKDPLWINSPIEKKVVKDVEIISEHNRYSQRKIKDTLHTPFSNESLGTKKILALLGPWFEAIQKGGVLLIDDFGSSFHSHLSCELIKVFQSALNISAQLIFTTHDTSLLRRDLLRRDQVWFTEKNHFGETDLYSLVEFKTNKAASGNTPANYDKDYRVGKYGAIPEFGNISQFVENFQHAD